jgi:hypothetical protein
MDDEKSRSLSLAMSSILTYPYDRLGIMLNTVGCLRVTLGLWSWADNWEDVFPAVAKSLFYLRSIA